MTWNLRFRLRRRVTGTDEPPADHLHGELAASEPGHAFYYGHGAGVGDLASASHLLFRSDGARLWHGHIGADDGSTVFKGDGSALTGVAAASVAWANVTGKPTTLAGYGITDGVTTGDSRLSDAREWTAATITQAEAEAGSATTRRAWTAQRVRQAIVAWWAGSADKTKLDGIAAGATVGATWGSNLASIPASIDAIDGLTPAADRLAYYTGASTAALATLTPAARALLDDTDAAAMRATLGLGSAATTAASAYATAAQGAKADSALQPVTLATPTGVTLVAADDGWIGSIDVTVSFTADPNIWALAVEYRVDGGAWVALGLVTPASPVARIAPVTAGRSYQARARAQSGPSVSGWATSSALTAPAITRTIHGGSA
ncbi:hypothetical protein [Gemmobacter nectariphilus]|uniref:hypothetical protein n=1 Tax=Gemmobacter nectariphilus TaxID=220343 RepID=UPI0004292504|nr:hypothetical protein [Gemmobacter nectariphilus]